MQEWGDWSELLWGWVGAVGQTFCGSRWNYSKVFAGAGRIGGIGQRFVVVGKNSFGSPEIN